MSNKTKNSNCFSWLRKLGSYKNIINFMAIVYGKKKKMSTESLLNANEQDIIYLFILNLERKIGLMSPQTDYSNFPLATF